MARLDLHIDVPDADMPRLYEAMRVVFGIPGASEAEVVEAIRLYGVANLIGAVQSYEKKKAQAQADAFTSNFGAS